MLQSSSKKKVIFVYSHGKKKFSFLFLGIENFMQTGDDYLFEDVIDLIYT
jgi:hypothetical protein